MSTFNVSFEIKSSLIDTITKLIIESNIKIVEKCAEIHGFDVTETLRQLCLEKIKINVEKAKKSVTKPKAGDKHKVSNKSQIPLPFIGSLVNYTLCNALTYNKGLFTQCLKKQSESSIYCKKCIETIGHVSGTPICGTVQQRLSNGLYEFKDSKGRSPISYLKFLEKQKRTVDDALEEATRLNVNIDEIHFRPIEVVKAPRGRPKKAVVEVNANKPADLYAAVLPESEPTVEKDVTKKPKKGKLSDEAKEANKLALKKKREEAKAAKEQEKNAAKEQEKQEKTKKQNTAPVEPTVVSKEPDTKDPDTKEPEIIKVKKFAHNGVTYKRSSDNILYSLEPKEGQHQIIGKWDPETETIIPLDEDEDEEDEEEDEEETYSTEVDSELDDDEQFNT